MNRREFNHLASMGWLVTSMATVRSSGGQEKLVIAIDSPNSKSHAQLIIDEFARSGIDVLLVFTGGANVKLQTVDRPPSFVRWNGGRIGPCKVIADGREIEYVQWADRDSGLLCRTVLKDGKIAHPIESVVEQYDYIEVVPTAGLKLS